MEEEVCMFSRAWLSSENPVTTKRFSCARECTAKTFCITFPTPLPPPLLPPLPNKKGWGKKREDQQTINASSSISAYPSIKVVFGWAAAFPKRLPTVCTRVLETPRSKKLTSDIQISYKIQTLTGRDLCEWVYSGQPSLVRSHRCIPSALAFHQKQKPRLELCWPHSSISQVLSISLVAGAFSWRAMKLNINYGAVGSSLRLYGFQTRRKAICRAYSESAGGGGGSGKGRGGRGGGGKGGGSSSHIEWLAWIWSGKRMRAVRID